MVVDFHTHIFPEKIAGKTITYLEEKAHIKAFNDGTEEGLIRSMEAAGVDVSVVLPVVTRPEQFHTINGFAAQLNEKYQDKRTRLWSFGGLHPDSADYKEELRTIKKLGLLGIKLHPDYQDTYFDDIKYMRILDYASELGLVSVVHAGVDVGFPDNVRCAPRQILRVIREVSPKNLVLAHYGSFDMWEEVEELLAGKEVYLDTAFTAGYIKDEVFVNILKKHGADRILFATDSPWSGQKESLQFLRSLAIERKDIDKILGQNAGKLIEQAFTNLPDKEEKTC
jgi:hypothetical protein